MIVLLLFSFMLTGCKEQENKSNKVEQSTPLLIEASKDDSKIYLFGSIHAADETLYPLPDYVKNAYRESDAIAVEFDLIEFTEDLSNQVEALTKFVYDDASIKDDIDEDTYNRSIEILKEAGLYSSIMDNFKPIMWQTLLENAAIMASNLDEQYGIDNHFLKLAKEDEKKIIELESSQYQYEMLSSFKKDMQIYLLKESIETFEESKENLTKLYELYKKGNEKDLEDIFFEEYDEEKEDKYLKEYNDKLITERNVKMTNGLEKAIKKDDTIFCVVGLGHIIGEGGIASLLENKGYTVEIIN